MPDWIWTQLIEPRSNAVPNFFIAQIFAEIVLPWECDPAGSHHYCGSNVAPCFCICSGGIPHSHDRPHYANWMRGEASVSRHASHVCLSNIANPKSQRKHWPKHKKPCKQRAAELHEEDLFKDPPAKEDCPICFLPMPYKLINCFSFPPATISSVLINDAANTHQGLADLTMAIYYSCCWKSICGGCIHSFGKTQNNVKCLFCNADKEINSDAEKIGYIMKRVHSITVVGY